MSNTNFERPTDELRQVRHEQYRTSIGGPGIPFRELVGVYYTVQRKWLVQDGECYEKRFWGEMPRAEQGEEVVGFSHIDHCNGSREGFVCEVWSMTKVKAEWRDLSIVSAEEAKKQST